MVKVTGVQIPPEWADLWMKVVGIADNRNRGVTRKRGYLPSRRRVNELTTKSLLPQIKNTWADLSDYEKAAWKNAAAVSGVNGYNLFTQDLAYRLKYGIPGLASPSLLHQYKVGRIEIAAPASGTHLMQYHPAEWYVSKKMRGNTQVYEDIKIDEILMLPLTVGASFRSSLTPTRPDYKVEFYATIYSSYQGRTIETKVGFDIPLSSRWTIEEATATEVIGVARSYDLHIVLDGVRGWLEWDNVRAIHTGTNFARDPRCTDVNNELTVSNWQIEKSWEEIFLPTGAAFDSVYPADEDTVGYGTQQRGGSSYGA